MLLVCCGVEEILLCDVFLQKLADRIIRKKGKIQSEKHWSKTHLRIRWKVEISCAPYDVEGEWKGALFYRKGEEIISDLELSV